MMVLNHFGKKKPWKINANPNISKLYFHKHLTIFTIYKASKYLDVSLTAVIVHIKPLVRYQIVISITALSLYNEA